MRMIYADNAATTPMSKAALKAMTDALAITYGNPSSLHAAGQQASALLTTSRRTIADCIGAAPSEITFTSCGSESDTQALRSAAALGKAQGKTHLITTAVEHHAVLHTMEVLEKEGFTVTVLPVEKNGILSVQTLKNALREDTALVSVMAANNEVGTLQPVQEIGQICRERQILFHVDAVQAVGHIPINVKTLPVDFLSMSAHKFHGPKGVGILYARKGVALTSLIYGGGQERGRRAGTENVPGIAGCAAALKEQCDHLQENAAITEELKDVLIDGLSQIPHSMLVGDRTLRLPGNVNFVFEGVEGESLLLLLDSQGIAASSGSACASGSLDPSHVLTACGLDPALARSALRLSIDETTTLEDVSLIIEAVMQSVERLRSMSLMYEEAQSGKRPHLI